MDATTMLVSCLLVGGALIFGACLLHRRSAGHTDLSYQLGYQAGLSQGFIDGEAAGLAQGRQEYHRCGQVYVKIFDDCGPLNLDELTAEAAGEVRAALENCLQNLQARISTDDSPPANTIEEASSN